jgi:outer membrane protein insertion porin family
MNFSTRAFALIALAASAVCAAAGPLVRTLGAQRIRDLSSQQERPEVLSVDFNGVKAVKVGDLRKSLATEPSACLSPFKYLGVCKLTKSPYFYERHYFDQEEFRRDVVRLLVFYYRRGWRDAQVDTTVARDDDGNVHVTFDVVEGPPTIVDTVIVTGMEGVFARRGGRRRATLGRTRLHAGDPLNLLRLDSNVVRLRGLLLDRGRGNAVVSPPTIDVDTLAHRARVTIAAHPGPLTPIARIDVIQLRGDHKVSEQTIRNSLTIAPGQLFRPANIASSQRALYESALFRSALIDTAVTTEAANGRTVCAQQGVGSPTRQVAAAVDAGVTNAARDSSKNVVICVLEGQLHDARVSVGFNTADFFAIQGQYADNYWLGGPRRLTVNGALGNLLAQRLNGQGIFFNAFSSLPNGAGQDSRYLAPTYQVGANLQQRWFRSPRNTLGGGVFLRRRSSPGVFIDRGYGANTALTRNLVGTKQLPLSATYRFELNRVEAGDVYFCVNFGACEFQTIEALQGQQRLSPAALTGSIGTADNALEPHQGAVGRLELEHASRVTFSDYRYNRVFGDYARYFTLPFRRSVLALHAQGGWVRALASTNAAVGVAGGDPVLHPSKRFYAGGSQSVRGFGENELGPRVLTIDPNLVRGRQVSSKNDTTFTCGGPGRLVSEAALRGCFAQRGDSISDRDFIERPLGGTTLALGSVELRVPIFGPLVGAVFVDGAVLGEKSLSELGKGTGAISPGFGVRYLSPVGPVRVDVGFRPKLTELLPVFTQLDVDTTGTRRLIDLTNNQGCSKSFNQGCRVFPLRESSSGIRRVLDRITLHLSIGEAF